MGEVYLGDMRADLCVVETAIYRVSAARRTKKPAANAAGFFQTPNSTGTLPDFGRGRVVNAPVLVGVLATVPDLVDDIARRDEGQYNG